MNSSKVPDNQRISVDEFIALAASKESGLEGAMQFSQTPENEIEVTFYDGLYTFTKEEFKDLMSKTPQSEWKEYPNDWAPDEVEEAISTIHGDLMGSLKQEPFAWSLRLLKRHLTTVGPAWAADLNEPDLDMLGRGVLKTIGRSDGSLVSPEAFVDRVLDDESR